MPQSAIDRLPTGRRNEAMEKISRNARRLRGGIGVAGVPTTAMVGRNDALEQLLVRLGVIPILTAPTSTSLTGYVQAPAGRRPAVTETTTVTGPSTPQAFAAGAPLVGAVFAAAGAGQVLTATDSVDAAAKGRGLIDVPA